MSSTTRKYIYTFPSMSRKLKPKLNRNLRQYSTVSLREMTTSGFDNLRDHKNKERLRFSWALGFYRFLKSIWKIFNLQLMIFP